MARIEVNGVSLHYEEHGNGAETILFVHGLLFDHHMFDAQVEALSADYRCIAFDLRGQGQSEVTRTGYDMDNLTRDTLALIAALNCGPVHFVGLSMGGFIGMRLAIHHAGLLRSVTLLDTSADAEPKENVPRYRLLAYTGWLIGFGPLTGQLLPIMFAKDTLADAAQQDMLTYWKKRLTGNNRSGSVRATMGVIKRDAVYQDLGKITTPTLIAVGEQDVATTLAKSQRIQQAIGHSKLVIIPGAGHSSSIEKPQEVTAAIRTFLAELPAQT